MNLRKIYIRTGNHDFPSNVNLFQSYEGFWQAGVEVAFFSSTDEIKTFEDLGPKVGLHGYIQDVHYALKLLGKDIPEPLDYPDSLYPFLGRHVIKSTLGGVRSCPVGVFVKPVEHKLFNGFVWSGRKEDRLQIATFPDSTPVWTSSVITLKSEYRVFVLNGEILDVRRYKGSWEVGPSSYDVRSMVTSYKNPPAAYALDVGVRGTGSLGDTVLIEVNDAFSLGGYGINSSKYAKMIDARWNELTS